MTAFRRPIVLLAAILAAAAVLAIPAFANVYVVGFLTRVVAYAILGVSLDLLLGYVGLVSFGHAAYVGIGAYAAGLLVLAGITNAFAGLAAAVLAAAISALAIGALAVRVKGIYFIMLTFAFGQMIFYLAVGQPQLGGDDGIPLPARMQFGSIGPLQNASTLFYVALLLLAGSLVLLRRFVRSPVGMAMQACRQDDIRLITLGFSTYRYRLGAFVLAGAIAGIGGFLLINLDAYLSPSLLDWRISGIITMIVVIGGVGTLVGPVIGAFLYLLVEELTSRYTDHWLMIFGLLLLAVSLGWKRGVYGVIESIMTWRRQGAAREVDGASTLAPSYRETTKSPAVGRQSDVSALLSTVALRASYGSSQTLFDISLSVGTGEVVALIGRNGMGKTTTIRAIMGMLPQTTGTIQFAGRSIADQPSHRIARCGLGLAPEGRQIFPTLTTRENLVVLARPPGFGIGAGWTLESVFALFPVLSERAEQRAATLSGGEQQMLAIGRALMTNPTLLILDEATEGLAPRIRQQIWQSLAALKRSGLAILLIDKNIEALSGLADRYYVLERGRVAWSGNSTQLRHDWQQVRQYLTV